MPHQCTNCGEIYPDGADEILSGCDECGTRKFQFVTADAEDSEPVAVEQSSPAPDTEQSSTPTHVEQEDVAQQRARSEAFDEDLWPDTPSSPVEGSDDDDIIEADEQPVEDDETVDSSIPFTGDTEQTETDLEELRERLSQQFGSIKIRAPGQYELNLMELYENDEYIITLEEDGRYRIESMGSWSPENRAD